jgi:hypothetical protein
MNLPMTKNSITRIATIAGLFLGSFAVAALAFGPHSNPPPAVCDGTLDQGCNAPVNVGTVLQEKLGPAKFHGLGVLGNISISGGTPDVGKVLTAVDTAGNATWQTSSLTFDSFFAFKRSPTTGYYTGDSVIWCPDDHPHAVSIQLIDDTAPSAPSLDSLTTTGCATNDFTCDGTQPGPINRTGGAAIGTDDVNFEMIKKGTGSSSVWGYRTYDSGHKHNGFKVDLLCAK